ncbi:MAG: TonB-dependent receptor [Deltaproteobacteria bacterium]|nr:MAG: TonB-dependent receptor [Deltaproteobacteria bacterium]
MNPRRTTIQVASILLLSAGLAAAQSQETPPPTESAPPSALPPTTADQQGAAEPAVPTSAPPPADRRGVTEELVVTGSRIRRKDLTTPAPVTIVTREQFESSGRMTIGDYLQTMPEQGNAPNFQLNTGGINYGADGTTRINLRSLGIQRTLVLINGRRVVPGGLGASAAVDLNTIPTEAVERVEILKDGASAVYGSDAIAGVVNIITRKSYNGTDLGAQYGSSRKADAQTFDAHVTTGTSGDVAGAIFSVRYFNQWDSWLRDRNWSQQALDFDYRPGKGVSASGSSRVPQGALRIPEDPANPGTPLCNGNALCIAMTQNGNWAVDQRYIRDPAGPFCGPNRLGQIECFRNFISEGSPNDFYNFAAQNYLTIPSTTIQGFSSGEAKFPVARGYYELSYTQRNSTQNAAPMPLNPGDYANIVYSKDSVYNPFGTDLNFLGRRLVEFGNRTYAEDLATFRVVTGLDGTLSDAFGPAQGWFWNASVNYGRTSGTFTTGGSFRNSRVQSATGPSVPGPNGPACVQTPDQISTQIAGCTPLNLLGGPGSIATAQQDFLGFTGTSRAYDQLLTAGADLAGDLFPLAADRPLSIAVGYEFRHQLGSQIADPIAAAGDSADFNFKSTSGGFHSNEAYAELLVPILSNMVGVESLEASLAGRYVNYSTFGDKFTYKLGARYTPVRDFTVRGTYSTAFRAPSISELFLGNKETDPAATDPCAKLSAVSAAVAARCLNGGPGAPRPGAAVTGSGSGDTGLQELTDAYTAGLVFQPQAVRNLSLTLDYFNVTVDNAIGVTGTPNILNGCYVGGVDEYCALIVRNNSGLIQYVDDFFANIGKIKTSGIDFAVRYAMPSDVGRFAFGFDGSWLAKYDITLKLRTGNATIQGKDRYDAGSFGALPQFKATSGLDWSLGGFQAGLTGRYVSSFDECSNPYDPATAQGGICDVINVDPVKGTSVTANPLRRRVHSYYQLDVHAGYTLTSTLGRTTLFAGIINLTDKVPPYIYSAALANSDPSTYDFVGRYIYGRIQHRF